MIEFLLGNMFLSHQEFIFIVSELVLSKLVFCCHFIYEDVLLVPIKPVNDAMILYAHFPPFTHEKLPMAF